MIFIISRRWETLARCKHMTRERAHRHFSAGRQGNVLSAVRRRRFVSPASAGPISGLLALQHSSNRDYDLMMAQVNFTRR